MLHLNAARQLSNSSMGSKRVRGAEVRVLVQRAMGNVKKSCETKSKDDPGRGIAAMNLDQMTR